MHGPPTEPTSPPGSRDAKVEIYDTTLRDGSQQVGLDLTVADKLHVAVALDALGVDVVEGGWPGSNPKDAEFFARAGDLDLAARPAGGVRRDPAAAPRSVDDDANLVALLAADTPIVTLVGKAWTLHVDEALRTTREENLAMVADSVRLHGRARPAGRSSTPSTSSTATGPTAATRSTCWPPPPRRAPTRWRCATPTAARCPTTPPASWPRSRRGTRARVGVHFHNDAACAVANSVVAVSGGALHVQGAANGYGERCGNADLFAVIAGLELKRGHELLPPGRLGGAGVHRPDDRRAREPAVRVAPALRRVVGVRHQGGAARLGHRPAAGRVLARRPGRGRQPAAGPGQRAGRAQQRAGQGGRARPGPERRPDAGQRRSWTRSRPPSTADTRSRPRTPRSSCWCAGPRACCRPGSTLEGYRVVIERGAAEDRSEAIVRLLLGGDRVVAVGEGVGPGARAGPGAAPRRWPSSTRRWPASTWSTTRCGSWTAGRRPARSPGSC